MLDEAAIAKAIEHSRKKRLSRETIWDAQRLLGMRPTGRWDRASIVALAGWQEGEGLAADGILGPETLGLLGRPAERDVPFGTDGSKPLPELLAAAVAQAEVDWNGKTSEVDATKAGRLAKIFADSGFSTSVSRLPSGRIFDWCGMAVCSWLVRVGLSHGLRRGTFLTTRNVHDFFTYARSPRNPLRTMTRVRIDGQLVRLADHHAQKGAARVWTTWQRVRSAGLEELDVLPGDIVLINHYGKTTGAQHITMVRSYQPPILETIEGNARGTAADGKPRRDAVIVNRRDLSLLKQRRKIFGIGRLSALDFTDLDYQP